MGGIKAFLGLIEVEMGHFGVNWDGNGAFWGSKW